MEKSQICVFVNLTNLGKKANAFFVLPPPRLPFHFVQRQAWRRLETGASPLRPRSENGKRKTEFVKIRFFANFTILLAQKAGDSSVGNGKRKAENGKRNL